MMDEDMKYKDKGWLKEQYQEKGLSLRKIAEKSNVSHVTIQRKLRKYGIKRRQEGWECKSHGNHIKLNNELENFIEGLLLGDGSLVKLRKGAKYGHTDKHKRYIEQLRGILTKFGIEQSGSIYYRTLPNSSTFTYSSRVYRELLELRNKWYPDDEKKIPEGVELSPTKLLNWYIGDGSYLNGHPTIAAHTLLQNSRQKIREELNKIEDLKFKLREKSIYFPEKRAFFNYILRSPYHFPCYSYKFPNDCNKVLQNRCNKTLRVTPNRVYGGEKPGK